MSLVLLESWLCEAFSNHKLIMIDNQLWVSVSMQVPCPFRIPWFKQNTKQEHKSVKVRIGCSFMNRNLIKFWTFAANWRQHWHIICSKFTNALFHRRTITFALLSICSAQASSKEHSAPVCHNFRVKIKSFGHIWLNEWRDRQEICTQKAQKWWIFAWLFLWLQLLCFS